MLNYNSFYVCYACILHLKASEESLVLDLLDIRPDVQPGSFVAANLLLQEGVDSSHPQ